jgi:hypothetical protein
LKNAGESTTEIDAEIAYLEELILALNSRPQAAAITLLINGNEITFIGNKTYTLSDIEDSITSIKVKSSSKVPLIINYSCDLNQTEDKTEKVVSAIDVSKIWGQVSGIFTNTDSILRAYDYDYASSETYRIYNTQKDDTIITDKYGNIIVDNTNINLY